MTLTGFTVVDDRFIVGASATPPTTDHPDGSEYWQTSDGTVSGAIVAIWRYEEDSDTWVQQPAGGGSTCPAPMTRAALITLRNGGGLNKDCHYVVTDVTQGNLGAVTVLLHAIDSTTLSLEAKLLTTFDNVAWEGLYDIDANQILEVRDNRQNRLVGTVAVNGFRYGDAQVYGNEIVRPATFVLTSTSEFSRNSIEPNTSVNVTGTAIVYSNVVAARGSLNASAGTFRDNQVLGAATVNQTGGTAYQNTFDSVSIATISGGTWRYNTLKEGATVTIASSDNYYNTIANDHNVFQEGTGFLRSCELRGLGTTRIGNTNLTTVTSEASNINTAGASGAISYCDFSSANFNALNVPDLQVTRLTLASNGQVSANNATQIAIRYTSAISSGRILASAGARMTLQYSSIDSYGYIQSIQGNLIANYSNASALGYIRNNSPNTNRVDRVSVRSQGFARFEQQANNCRIYYTTCNSSGYAEHSGTANNSYIYYSNASSNGKLRVVGSVRTRIYYCEANSNGTVIGQNDGSNTLMYYCTAISSSTVQSLNNDGAGTRMYSCTASATSIIRLQNSPGNARLYYSSATAYYYLFLTLNAVTRSALHGYGRRSYTVTDPANGTFVQNF